jgi:hypothetical protein
MNCVCVKAVYNRSMDKTVDELIRQQYLVPRRSVAKLRQLSKQQKVSATEIVRRAIDAYDPLSGDRVAQEAAALDLLAEVHGELRKAMRRIDTDMAALRQRQQALGDGRVRDRARRETESWLRQHPRALAGFADLFAVEPGGTVSGNGAIASAIASGNGTRSGAARGTAGGARVRALRR